MSFPALFVTDVAKMTFDYGATVKNLTLTFWPKNIFEVNIHVEKAGKNFGTKKKLMLNFSRQAHNGKVTDCHALFRILRFLSWAVFWAEILI